jgi:hypothetical protein
VALSLRCYLFQEDGAIKRIPRRVVDGLVHGQDAMPEYVNSVQRIATAVVDNENGKALRIVGARGEYWTFDEEGKIHKGLSESFAQVMSMVGDEPSGNRGKVVSLKPALRRRDFQLKHQWHLTKEDLDWIAADIWPSENGTPAPITIATGKAPRRPTLTYEAKEALRKIEEKLASVGFELERLSEPALKGLAFEAREKVSERGGLWAGLADECDRLREVRARRRTGRGIWYAVIEAERPDTNDVDLTHIEEIAFEKCSGRKLAAEAARRLLKEHADTLREDLMLRSALYSELEWEPQRDR